MLVAWMEDVSERHVVEKNNGRCVRLECNVAMTSPPRARSFVTHPTTTRRDGFSLTRGQSSSELLPLTTNPYFNQLKFHHYSNMGGLDQGLRSRYFSSSVTLAAFQSFRNSSTGLRHLSCTIIIPNNFPFASAFSTASHPPSAHRARVYAIGSNSLSTPYSDFRRAWLRTFINDISYSHNN